MMEKPFINAIYLITAILFILGLKKMSSPVTARRGIFWAGMGMVLATLITLEMPGMANYGLMLSALVLGIGLSWWSGKTVKMTDMPQMVALYNGMGGGSAAAIAALELARGAEPGTAPQALAVLGGLIGTISFSGSLVAFAKLQGILRRAFRLPGQNSINSVLGIMTLIVAAGLITGRGGSAAASAAFFGLAFALGIVMTMPIGGADMPVVISLFNAMTGLAVGFEGYALNNPALIVAGVVVGAAGSLLTQLMARAMNRSLVMILFRPITGDVQAGGAITGSMKEISGLDAAAMLRFAQSVIIVPGYGMAVAQAQHKVRELAELLESLGVSIRFAIHPVAGRMPGHMNVLLAEAGVPYEKIFDLEEINSEFEHADIALVIGANDVVNPAARSDAQSPIYGMPILNADKARTAIVIKRGNGAGYSGIENRLFYADNARMLYGNAQPAVNEVIRQIKEMEQ